MRSVGEVMVSSLKAEVSRFIYDACRPRVLSEGAGSIAGAASRSSGVAESG